MTDTPKFVSEAAPEARHSALAEFSRDERRPAVLLLSALVIAVLFFGIGLLFGRWTAKPSLTPQDVSSQRAASPNGADPAPQPTNNNVAGEVAPDSRRRFSILVATYDAPEKSKPILKLLQDSGYKDIRTTTPRAGERRPSYSVLVGRFTQEEARDQVRRMRTASDPRLKNAKVVEAAGN